MEEIKITKQQQRELFYKAMFGSSAFTIIASIFATFIIGAIFARVGGGVPINVTSTPTEKTSTFDANGEGKVYVVPDEAQVRFGMSDEGVSVDVVQGRVNSKVNALVDYLKDLGVGEEMIKTTSYNVYPKYDYEGARAQITGYQVSVRVLVRFSDFSLVNEAFDHAATLGLNQVGGLQFVLSDEAYEEAMSEARKIAVEKAKSKAKELAKLAGVRLGKVINVVEGGGSSPRYLPMAGGGSEAVFEGSGAEVQPGTSEVVVNVTLSYETR